MYIGFYTLLNILIDHLGSDRPVGQFLYFRFDESSVVTNQ